MRLGGDMEDKKNELIDGLIEKRICVSKAQARRMVAMMPEEEVRKRIDRVKIIKTR